MRKEIEEFIELKNDLKKNEEAIYHLFCLLFFGIIFGVLIYLVFSFATLTFNPENWTQSQRAVACVIQFGLIIITAGVLVISKL